MVTSSCAWGCECVCICMCVSVYVCARACVRAVAHIGREVHDHALLCVWVCAHICALAHIDREVHGHELLWVMYVCICSHTTELDRTRQTSLLNVHSASTHANTTSNTKPIKANKKDVLSNSKGPGKEDCCTSTAYEFSMQFSSNIPLVPLKNRTED